MNHDLGSDVFNMGSLSHPFDPSPKTMPIAYSNALKPSKKLLQSVESFETSTQGSLEGLLPILIHPLE